MIDNIIVILLILIYLTFVIIINCYTNLSKKKLYKVRLEKKDIPAKLLFCYGVSSPFILFKVTLLDLIDRDIFLLKKEKGKIFIKYNKEKVLTKEIFESEQKVIDIVNNYIKTKQDDITLEEMDRYFSSDFCYASIVYDYYTILKNEVLSSYGVIDKYLNYIGAFVISFLYSLQVLFFIDYKFNLILALFLMLSLTFTSLIITKLLNKVINDVSLKKYIVLYFTSILLSIVSFYVWKNDRNNDYLIFHLILGILSFMYPLLIYTNLMFVKKNRYFKNNKQYIVVNYINEIKEKINKKTKYNRKDYIYMVGLNMKYDIKEVINSFIK